MEPSLIHFGVKGMKWGKHTQPTHPNYSTNLQYMDAKDFGNRGVSRINDRMHKGQSHSEAVTSEKKRRVALGISVAAAAIAAEILSQHGPVLLQNIAVRAEAKRGQAAAAAIRGISNKTFVNKITKPGRNGVYKITSL